MKKVLIVDDDVFLTGLYATLLQKEGVKVDVVNSGTDALNWLSTSTPDLIVLDIHMPGMKGTDVLRAIRNDMRLSHLYVIVFATGYLKSLVSEVGELGVQKVISKMKCRPRSLVAEIKDSLASLEEAAAVPEVKSDLEIAVEHIENPDNEDCSVWLERLHSDSRDEARRICLLHIYSMYRGPIMLAMRSDALSPEGKLGRALKKLLDDLYDHPHLIQDSTAESLGQALRKLQGLNADVKKVQLESEAMLKDVLDGL